MKRRTSTELVVVAVSVMSVPVAMTLVLSACGDDPSSSTPPPDGDGGTDVRPLEDGGDAAPAIDAQTDADAAAADEVKTRFVLLGDFGFDDGNEAAVASLVKTWKPDFVVTLGDNSYP